MRILIAHSFYRLSGGEDRYVTQQVDLLREAGHEVELLARRNEDLPGGLTTAQRMTYSRVQTSEVSDVISRFSPDVIHVHNIYPALGPGVHLAAKRASVPLVMTVHNFRLRCPNGYMFTEGAVCRRCQAGNYLNGMTHHCFPERSQALAYSMSLWAHRFILRLERMVDLFIAPSRFFAEQLSTWGIETNKILMVRNFADAGADASAESGTGGLYLGRLSSEKGLDVLLKALARADDPPFKIVGDGPSAHGLRALAESLNLRRTQFTGPVPHGEASELLIETGYVVMPSLSHENAPLAALEAMRNGCALVVTKRGGLPELVQSGGGLLVEAGDPRELSAAISRLQSTSQLRQCARSALAFARQHLTAEVHLSQLEAGYHAVAEQRLTPGEQDPA